MRKVFIEGNDPALQDMFQKEDWELCKNPVEADLICLEGGADVQPELYFSKNTHSTTNPIKDVVSAGLWAISRHMGIPIVGICRGGQFLNVMKNGVMDQHVDNHCVWHDLDMGSYTVPVSSAHHQVMIPDKYNWDQIIYSDLDNSVEILIDDEEQVLAFQPHPEYHEQGHPCWKLFFKLVDRIM